MKTLATVFENHLPLRLVTVVARLAAAAADVVVALGGGPVAACRDMAARDRVASLGGLPAG